MLLTPSIQGSSHVAPTSMFTRDCMYPLLLISDLHTSLLVHCNLPLEKGIHYYSVLPTCNNNCNDIKVNDTIINEVSTSSNLP